MKFKGTCECGKVVEVLAGSNVFIDEIKRLKEENKKLRLVLEELEDWGTELCKSSLIDFNKAWFRVQLKIKELKKEHKIEEAGK